MEENDKKDNRSFNIFIWIIVILVSFIYCLLIHIYLDGIIGFDKSAISSKLGALGDFVGGLLNPVFAFLGFIFLLVTIRIQSKELKTSREEMEMTRTELARSADSQKEQSNSIKLQNFENTFFNLLSLHNDIVKNIHYNKYLAFITLKDRTKIRFQEIDSRPNTEYIEGREALKDIVQKIDTLCKQESSKTRVFNGIYDSCHNASQAYIGHYFGNIYQILKFISTDKNTSDKKKYANLFRAQFSSSELKLLFYHCCGDIGIKKFKEYIEEFNFFEHLVIEEDNLNFKYILCNSFYESSAFGKNEDNIKKIISDSRNENLEWLKVKTFETCDNKNPYIYRCYINGDFDSVLRIMEKSDTNFSKLVVKEINETIYNLKTYSLKPL